MKRILLVALFTIACATSCQNRGKETTASENVMAQAITSANTIDFSYFNTPGEEKVYICTGSSSKRYHSKKNCRGLSNCGGTIKEITVEQAEKQGRTPCKICCQ